MTQDQVIALMRAIYILAATPYPFPEKSEINPKLSFAFGEILGIANKTLSDLLINQKA